MWKTAPLVLALALLAPGCGDDSSGSADMTAVVVPHNFDQINTQILQGSCANFTVCHGSKMTSTDNLDLKTDPYTALVNAPAVNPKAASEGKLLVKPCDSASSFLVIKLSIPSNMDQDLTTGYGHHMPDTNPNLPAEQIQAIKDWIDRGALKNEPANVTGKTCMVTDMGAAHD